MSKNKALLFVFLPLIIASCVVFGIFLGAFLTPSSANNETLIFPQPNRFNTATKLNEILNFIEDELSNEEYELALSTQFFNDRLILDGNLGY